MTIHLDSGAAEVCIAACGHFIDTVRDQSETGRYEQQHSIPGSFDTARQISTVYSLFAGEDLRTLLNGYVDQAKAMSMLFAAAGGLIEAQDEALAAALGKAAQEPAGMQSLGLMGSLGGVTALLDAADVNGAVGGYDRVGPEEVSGAPLARMVAGAQALEPGQFTEVSARVGPMAVELHSAADKLQSELSRVLGSQWQGEFATQALASVGSFTKSVAELATVLEKVASKADGAEDGFSTTRDLITKESAFLRATQLNEPGFGPLYGPSKPESAAAIAAAEAAAEEQARATVNNVYSPAVMNANLADLDFPTPYRVVSTSALGGANGVDLASVWNVDGVVRPAGAAVPSAAAIAAAGGGGGFPAEIGTLGEIGGVGATGATTATWSTAATDAATEQALVASRGSAGDSGGALAGAAGQTTAGGAGAGGVNASTHAAATPFAPMGNAAGQTSGAGGTGAGTRGIRNGASQRDRGFGSAAGTVGGSGAAAAGAGAARMGGAGTLAGLGSSGAGGLGASAPGAGSATAGAAGPGAGAFSSSSTGGAQAGRAGIMPMGMMGASAGQNADRRGHTPAGYLTNAANASELIGDPVKVAPAVLGRKPGTEESATDEKPELDESTIGRVIGRGFTGGGAGR